MTDTDGLAASFEQHRGHLRGVAYRMLGSLSEAEDAVQEGWLRLQRSDTSEVENLKGWLTTVVARVCLDMLHRRSAQPARARAGSDRVTRPRAATFLLPDNSTPWCDETAGCPRDRDLTIGVPMSHCRVRPARHRDGSCS